MKKAILIFFFAALPLFAQREIIPIEHPVYDYLRHAETRGFLGRYSLADLPLRKDEIVAMLRQIDGLVGEERKNERSSLDRFLRDFDVIPARNAVVFHSSSDSINLFSSELFGDAEKFIYKYGGGKHNAEVEALAGADYAYSAPATGDPGSYVVGTLGFRLSGTLSDKFGFYLQATNGRLIAGSRELAQADDKYGKSVKFVYYNSDIDLTESSVSFVYDWFGASIGRVNRSMGAGFDQKLMLAPYSTAFDAIELTAKFSNFEYKYMHGSLLSPPKFAYIPSGFVSEFTEKYIALHRFTAKPSWGEVNFYEAVIYSGRNWDLGYLNPLSFFKSLEHALHDRDNSLMGLDLSAKPFNRLTVKGQFLIDDIIFESIGKGFWGNKTAWSLGAEASLTAALDAGFEYTRVEPYMYSHFNQTNSYMNDNRRLASSLPPNSDLYSATASLWYGGRYPVKVTAYYYRHGENVTDANGFVIRNVGSDPRITRRQRNDSLGIPEDALTVTFLDGVRSEYAGARLEAGYEILRGLSAHINLDFSMRKEELEKYVRFTLLIGDF
ncbi:MAG: hypothetical protein ACM3U1_09320 [Chloroflexota bacterium]